MEYARRLGLSLTSEEKDAITSVLTIGTVQAGRSLSRLTGIDVQISPPEPAVLSIGDVPPLFGGLSTPAIGVLIGFHGDVEGNTLLLFPDEGISEMEGLLFPNDMVPGEDLKESAFAEVGNILSGTMLTVLSSLSERILINLPPMVVHDMAGAIIDTILAEVGASSDSVLALVSRIAKADGSSLASSVLIPDQAGIDLILEAAKRLKIAR